MKEQNGVDILNLKLTFVVSILNLIHSLVDLGHDGFTNAYHIATQSALAITYNDRTVLENYHSAALFTIMSDDDCNIFKNVPADDFKL